MSSQRDFDFLLGRVWRVTHSKLNADGGWDAFEGDCELQPVLGGLGHVDRMTITGLPGVDRTVHAFTVRLYEPDAGLWRIWWSSDLRPGHLDPPMTGAFADGIGVFEGDDAPGAPPARLRFRWERDAPGGPRWEQARKFEGTEQWRTDWTMQFTPLDPG